MTTKLTYLGEVRENGLHVFNRKIMDEQLRHLHLGKEVKIEITRKRKTRSNPQNRYYWGCVIPIIQNGLFEAHGQAYSDDETHEFLKANFNANSTVNEKNGEVYTLPQSTARLTTTEYEEYLERVREFAREYLGCEIPLPNEQTNLEI